MNSTVKTDTSVASTISRHDYGSVEELIEDFMVAQQRNVVGMNPQRVKQPPFLAALYALGWVFGKVQIKAKRSDGSDTDLIGALRTTVYDLTTRAFTLKTEYRTRSAEAALVFVGCLEESGGYNISACRQAIECVRMQLDLVVAPRAMPAAEPTPAPVPVQTAPTPTPSTVVATPVTTPIASPLPAMTLAGKVVPARNAEPPKFTHDRIRAIVGNEPVDDKLGKLAWIGRTINRDKRYVESERVEHTRTIKAYADELFTSRTPDQVERIATVEAWYQDQVLGTKPATPKQSAPPMFTIGQVRDRFAHATDDKKVPTLSWMVNTILSDKRYTETEREELFTEIRMLHASTQVAKTMSGSRDSLNEATRWFRGIVDRHNARTPRPARSSRAFSGPSTYGTFFSEQTREAKAKAAADEQTPEQKMTKEERREAAVSADRAAKNKRIAAKEEERKRNLTASHSAKPVPKVDKKSKEDGKKGKKGKRGQQAQA